MASLFVILVILLSIGKKQSLIIGISIPFSFLLGMGTVYAMGYTLNIVVLYGFVLAVGMIVDASTIVVEYADNLIKSGMKVKRAYVKSATRMAIPVISATVGIIVVYMPLLFWPGIMGKFMKYVPIVIILVLTYSIICAMLVVPVVAFVIEKTPLKNLSTETKINIFAKITPIYEKVLNKVLDNPKGYVKRVCIVVALVFIGYQFLNHGTTFFPETEPRNLSIVIKSKSNISLNNRIKIAKDIEDRVMKAVGREVKILYSKVGDPESTQTSYSSDVIMVFDIEMINWRHRRFSNKIINDINKALKDVNGVIIEVSKEREGPSTGKPIELQILSNKINVIDKYADDLFKYMKNDNDFKDIDDSRSSGKTEILVEFDKNLGSLYGIYVSDLYYPLASMTKGYVVGSYRPDDNDDAVDIVIKVPSELHSLKEMENITIYSPQQNKNIAITNFAKFKPNKEISFIKRINGYYSITLSSNVADGVVANNKILQMQKYINKNYNNQNDVIFKFGGDMENQKETGSFLLMAFFVALLIKFIILVAQYNSIYYAGLTLSIVVLAVAGVLTMLVIFFKPLCVAMTGLGIIAIAGVVVSNNIVLIDTFQELINKEKMNTRDAVLKTAISRFRPVLITTTTTILGLLPMMFNISIDFSSFDILINAPSGQMWEDMSTTIAGGVLCSLILTLTFTPAMLMIKSPRDEEDE